MCLSAFNLSLDGIDVDHVDNLPTKCADDIKDIKSRDKSIEDKLNNHETRITKLEDA